MTVEYCDECGNAIPATEPDMVNCYHAPSCSLHPSAGEDMPNPWADEGQSDARELARDRYDD